MQIHQALERLESEQKILVLMAVQTGSREWGYAGPASDIDVQFIYSRGLQWYMQLDANWDDTIERRNMDGVELVGWNLAKALRLLHKGSPQIHEMIQSSTVFMQVDRFREDLERRVSEYFHPRATFFHYTAMARGNFTKYIAQPIAARKDVSLKKYIVVLRSMLLAMYVQQLGVVPPMNMDVLMGFARTAIPGEIYDLAVALLNAKRSGMHLDRGQWPEFRPLETWLALTLELLHASDPEGYETSKEKKWTQLNRVFRTYATLPV